MGGKQKITKPNEGNMSKEKYSNKNKWKKTKTKIKIQNTESKREIEKRNPTKLAVQRGTILEISWFTIYTFSVHLEILWRWNRLLWLHQCLLLL